MDADTRAILTAGPARFSEEVPTSGTMTSVKGLVLHHTGGRGDVAGVVKTLRERGLGSQYVMDRDGTVYRVAPDGARTLHTHDYNDTYEGLEVIAKDDSDITPQQIASFQQFEQWHSATNGYTPSAKTVLSHGELSDEKRPTEGATLKWSYLKSTGFAVPNTAMIGDDGTGKPAGKFNEIGPRPAGTIVQATPAVSARSNSSVPRVIQAQLNSPTTIRNRAIDPNLATVLETVGNELDVHFVVGSGGQTSSRDPKLYKKPGGWTGAHRHDDGRAADVKAFTLDADGNRNYLDWSTRDGEAKWREIVRLSVSLGATGVGAGVDYMGTQTVHIGYGPRATWGTIVKGGPPPPTWVTESYDAGRRTPPGSIPVPAVATEVDTGLGYAPNAHNSALAEIQAMVSATTARQRLLDSAAMYGVNLSPDEYPSVEELTDKFLSPIEGLHRLTGARLDTFDPVGAGPVSWFGANGLGEGLPPFATFAEMMQVPVPPPLPRPRPEPPGVTGVPLPRPRPEPPAVGTSPPAKAATPNSRDQLQQFTDDVYGGIIPKGPGDENLATAYDVPTAAPTKDAPEKPAKQPEYATLPGGKQMIEVGIHRNSQGELVEVRRGPGGEAVFEKIPVPWYLREGEGTIAGGIVRQQVIQTATDAAKQAIDAATGAATNAGGTLGPAVNGAGTMIKRGIGGIFGGALDRLEELATAVRSGKPTIAPSDELENEPSWIPARLRPPTVIPAGPPGRWEISPAPVRSQPLALTAPKLTTSIAFDMPMPGVDTGGFSRNAEMALAFDKFTLPPALAPKPSSPAIAPLPWTLLDGPGYVEFERRRQEIAGSRDKPKMPAPVTESETRKEMRLVRPPKPSTATINPPAGTVPREVKEAPRPQLPKVAPTPRAPITRVSAPTYKVVSTRVDNPEYIAWEKKYGGGAPAPAGADSVGKGLGTFGEFQTDLGLKPAQVAPVPITPPAPPRYITTTKTVTVPGTVTKVAPTPRAPITPSGKIIEGTYRVIPGDSLSVIAKRAGVSVAELQRLNPQITNPNRIFAGSDIVVRGSAAASPARSGSGSSGRNSGSGSSGGASSGVSSFKGSASGRTYEVGKVYVNSQGVRKVATADGKFVEI